MVIKMLALTVRGYFKSHWNKLDFFIIVMATAGEFNLYVDCIFLLDKILKIVVIYLYKGK